MNVSQGQQLRCNWIRDVELELGLDRHHVLDEIEPHCAQLRFASELSQGAGVFFVELTALAIVSLALLSIFWSTITLGISPMPTSTRVKQEVLALIPDDLDGEVHELGAGWGTLAWAVASKFPRARVIGSERSPFPFLFCRLRLLLQPRENLTIRFGDLHRADLRGARLVLTYLWTGAMLRLGPKFDAELPDGALVISHTFAWRGKEPELTRTTADLYRTPVYRYRITRP